MIHNINLKAPDNWINDPNGFIFYKGKYHLFYQYFPYGPRWGTMHWGHAKSRDLVTWEHQKIALFPSRYEDQNGCFSGSAVEHEGKLYLYYTGVRYDVVNPEDIHTCINDQFTSAQLMISSEDGEKFDNYRDKRVVIETITDESIGSSTHTRDPKVWRGKDAWYMVIGSTLSEISGELLFYKSNNLRDWSLVNSTSKECGLGWMWECPDFFETDGAQVLVFSPMGIMEDDKTEKNHAICMLVDFEEESCTMKIGDDYQFLDYGLDLYAPQSTLDKDGRRVLVAWARMPEPVDGAWSGIFCLPRVVEVNNGHIYFRVHPNIKSAFTRKASDSEFVNKGNYRISLELENGNEINIGGLRVSRRDNCICADRSEVYPKAEGSRLNLKTPEIQEGKHLDIYVNPNLIEVYINDGEYVLSSVVYGLKEFVHLETASNVEIHAAEEK